MIQNEYNKIIDKLVNTLIKKYPYVLSYKNDLKQEGYLLVETAIKSFDKSKGVPLSFWVRLYVYNHLRNYIRDNITEYTFNKDVCSVDVVETVGELPSNSIYFGVDLEKLTLVDKLILYFIILKRKSIKEVSELLSIPRKDVKNILENTVRYLQNGVL